MEKVITVESVTEGHPDKVCDQISDAILDEYLKIDPNARVAIETFGCHGLLVIGGEVTSKANVNVVEIAKKLYQDIGYANDLKILTKIEKQSPDIALGVDTGGAGDQGIMYGYATNETSEYLPKAIVLVHKITKFLAEYRKNNPEFVWLKSDGKAQVTYAGNKLKTILISVQHDKSVKQQEIKSKIIEKILPQLVNDLRDVEIIINPTGKFELGGFEADTGLTGRKIMVDTYCGLIPHGGGAFSGKDPSKVDRSAAYFCRYVAKNIVANGLAKQCLVSVAYAIGKAEPLMISVETKNGYDQYLTDFVKNKFDFRPDAIIEKLNLRQPIYLDTAKNGHFTNQNYPWEKTINLED
ncbi:methionine adenosyltransferase [Patescibacteria group bacterium]